MKASEQCKQRENDMKAKNISSCSGINLPRNEGFEIGKMVVYTITDRLFHTKLLMIEMINLFGQKGAIDKFTSSNVLKSACVKRDVLKWKMDASHLKGLEFRKTIQRCPKVIVLREKLSRFVQKARLCLLGRRVAQFFFKSYLNLADDSVDKKRRNPFCISVDFQVFKTSGFALFDIN